MKVNGTLLRQRLDSIVADIDSVTDLSPEDAKALVASARALTVLVGRQRAFGGSIFRLLQTTEELRMRSGL